MGFYQPFCLIHTDPTDEPCGAAIITDCGVGTDISTPGANRASVAIIGDWNCDYVSSYCKCRITSQYRPCTPADVGY